MPVFYSVRYLNLNDNERYKVAVWLRSITLLVLVCEGKTYLKGVWTTLRLKIWGKGGQAEDDMIVNQKGDCGRRSGNGRNLGDASPFGPLSHSKK